MYRLLVLLPCFAALTACATVARGTTNNVVVNYSPADAVVTTSLGHTCKTNPCNLKVSRKEDFTVTAMKDGFQTQQIAVTTKVSKKGAAGMAGNILIGGVIGAGVDVATGAAKDHYPNPVNINLIPVGAAPATEPAPRPRKKGVRSTPTS